MLRRLLLLFAALIGVAAAPVEAITPVQRIVVLGAGSGLITPAAFDNSRENAPGAHYVKTSTFGSITFDTASTSLTINSYNDLDTDFAAYRELGVYVGGVYQSVTFTGAGAQSSTISLPGGFKRVKIVNGLQTRPTSLQGTFLVSVTGNAKITRVGDPANNLLVVYGDSIAAGGSATSPTGEAFAMWMRRHASRSVAVEAYGFRALYDDCVDATARAAFVAKIVAWNPAALYIQIGTNDYGLNYWTAANFGTAYTALLDDLHTALPSLQVYAQSPFSRTFETDANGVGSALPDYRAAIVTAATGRAWVTYIDGSTIIGTQSTIEGIHPTSDGHYGVGQYIIENLGLASARVSDVIVGNGGVSVALNSTTGLYLVTKTSGADGFNAGAYSAATHTGDFYYKFVKAQASDGTHPDILGGMTTAPGANNNYPDVNYAIYQGTGFSQAFESGTGSTTFDNGLAAQVPLWIVRQGTTLTYRYGYNPLTAPITRTVTGVSSTLSFKNTVFRVGEKGSYGLYSNFTP